MVEKEAPGGQAGMSSRIENYLGFPSGVSGADLARRAATQAKRFGVEILSPQEVTKLRVEAGSKFVTLADGTEIGAKAMVIATGVAYRKLNVPGMERVYGAGVYYGAAMTEAVGCKGRGRLYCGRSKFGRAGGGVFRAVREARGDAGEGEFAGSGDVAVPGGPDPADEQHCVELNSAVVEVFGEEHLEAISIHCATSGETNKVAANSLFIFIGAMPGTEWLAGVLEREEKGFVLSGPDLMRDGKPPKNWPLERDPWLLESSVPGIFVAGDVRYRSVKRVASGVGEGANAVQFVHQYLSTV